MRTISTILFLAAAIMSAAEDGSSGSKSQSSPKPNAPIKPTAQQGRNNTPTAPQDKFASPAPSPPFSTAAQLQNPKEKAPKALANPELNADGGKGASTPPGGGKDEGPANSEEKTTPSFSWVYLGLILIFLAQVLTIFLSGKKVQAGDADMAGKGGVGQEVFTDADRAKLNEIKSKISSLATNHSAKSDPVDKFIDVANKVNEIATTVKQLDESQGLRQALKNAEEERDKALKDLAPAHDQVAALKVDLAAMKTLGERAQAQIMKAGEEISSLRQRANALTAEAEGLLRDKNAFETELTAVRGALSSAESALGAARLAGQASASQLEASFVQLAPKTLVDPDLLALMRKLHVEALAGSVSATAAWSTLTAFAAADADPQAKDFQLHILKRLGTVLVNYWKGQGSLPKDSHERLTHWARCLNEQAKGRYNLFVPAIGAPVDRTKMTTASSASIVQDVLCWQVRNPAGANYSLAEVA